MVAVALGTLGSAGAAGASAPGAPTITSAKPSGLNGVLVSFSKPSDDGGARVSSYRATCTSTNGGVASSHNGTASPVRVPALTAGRTYTCTVTASNVAGSGPASDPSSPVVARPTVPGPPTIKSVAAIGLRSLTITFVKPANNGYAPISDYRATCTSSDGGSTRSQQGKSPLGVGGLTAAATYTCTVAGHNRIGVGTPSAPSAPAVPLPHAPSAPTITSVQATGKNGVLVTFKKPASDGGAPITHYLVECRSSNGGKSHSTLAPHSPIRVNGLTAGKTYTCTVAATNNVRLGPPSKPSKPFVPRPN